MESRGAVNKYTCRECNNIHYTINLAHGTTPFATLCPFCYGLNCLSNFYRLNTTSIIVLYCWYRPSIERYRLLNTAEKEHVLKGGLLHAALGTARILIPDPVKMHMSCFEILQKLDKTYKAYKDVCDGEIPS